MKKHFITLLLIASFFNAGAQTAFKWPDLSAYSALGQTQIRANIAYLSNRSNDSLAKVLRSENPIIDTNYFKIVNGRVTLSDKFMKSLYGKADSAALANYKASNDIDVASLKTARTVILDSLGRVNVKVVDLKKVVDSLPVSGVTPQQLKDLADKVEAVKLTIPNGLTYPKP